MQAALVGYVQNGGLYGMADSGTGRAGASQMSNAVANAVQLALKQSFTDAINRAFRIAARTGLGAVLVSLLMAGKRRPALTVERGASAMAPRTISAEEDKASGE